MRILLVSANQEHTPDPVVPLGALHVAGALRRAGHEVSLYDACFAGEGFEAELRGALLGFSPELVAISLRNVDDVTWPEPTSYLAHYQRVVAAVRDDAPGRPLVLGGSAFTLFPRELMELLRPDHGIAGEGEDAMVALCEELSETHGARASGPSLRVAPPIRDLDRLAPPALDLADLAAYDTRGGAVNVQTRRGCGFRCEYCTYPVLEGTSVRLRSPALVAGGLERLHAERGLESFFVVDNTFDNPRSHALSFCRELVRRRLPIRWTCYASPHGLDSELAAAMVEAGCTSVDLGTEAAAPETLAGLGKSFGPERILAAGRACRAAGLAFCHSLLLGGPGETPDTLQATADCIADTNPTAVVAMLGVRLYPGTGLARRAVAEGLVPAGGIGLEPVFYVAPAVRGVLVELAERMARERGWVVPALQGDRLRRYFARQRAHGRKGPLWELSRPRPT